MCCRPAASPWKVRPRDCKAMHKFRRFILASTRARRRRDNDRVIASEAKQSSLRCRTGLLRRYAPRNDDAKLPPELPQPFEPTPNRLGFLGEQARGDARGALRQAAERSA